MMKELQCMSCEAASASYDLESLLQITQVLPAAEAMPSQQSGPDLQQCEL